MTAVILAMLIGLAAVNGANDVSKGVATLAGAGVAAYRTAIIWGALTTLAGALLSVQLGQGMGKLFSSGIVDTDPTEAFALAVLLGTTSWVALASVARLPVSTTHAIVGALVGGGLVLAPEAIQWQGVLRKVLLPLLLSIVVAYAISVGLALLTRALGRPSRARPEPLRATAAVGATRGGRSTRAVTPMKTASTNDRGLTLLHWISSGATSCARGLNDTPKIAAIGGFALLPHGYSPTGISILVAGAMAVGSLAGIRVARRLGDNVLKMTHTEGFTANLTTAGLVTSGALLAFPMSTTHVSTGAIVGAAGGQLHRVSGRTVRDFVIAWTVTPFCTAIVAALAMTVVR
ncbi:inorganic phosphate transporter, PiT family [Micromonospora nigra]|uniref:Inorganic phosphate transporter, PiT family n=1 Tax=Micromonospora nigra TaxID=145857 RepID=A0A1C6RD33_9ACTN|nr:inorganic phosphate transporter [Micromonospora nigra]SCL15048.1 inorganic phosphate transporter, PiT family [Micromonospora nigra]